MIDTFAGLLEGLARHRVKFAVVGGLAVALNGFERTTQAVDILLDNAPDNVARLASCLAEFGHGVGGDLRADEVTDEPGAIRISEKFDLDVFVRMNGKTLADFEPMLLPYTFPSGEVIRYLNHDALIETKQGSVRHKDKADIGALRDRQQNPPPSPGSTFSFDSFRDPPDVP